MTRVIVIADEQPTRKGSAVLLDERVQSVHLSDEHSASQLVERLAWAVGDAEHAERTPRARRRRRSGAPAIA